MIRLLNTLFPKSLVVAAAGAGMFVATIGDASACDGRRGGIVRAIYGSAYGGQYVQRPVQPYCPQQQFQQPLVQQQFPQQQFPQQQMVPPQVQQLIPQGQQVQIQGQQQQFGQGQQVVQQGQQQVVQGQQQVVQGQQFQQGVAQQGIAQQGIAQQQVQSNTVVTQNSNVAAPIGGAGTAQSNTAQPNSAQPSVSAIGALGGSAPAASGVQNQAVAPTQTTPAPSQNLAAPALGNADAPATGNTAQAPAASAEQTATESALQALMGDTAPVQSSAAQPVTAAPASAPIGEFSATLSNGTTIRLSLRADGSFAWVATKGDKVSTFQGTFSFGGTSLTLNRASDSQKLEGALALTANGFKLQLNGQNAEGLNFVRA